MSVVRVAVPVLEGRRRFQYDKGRPWTMLEHLVLAALAERNLTAAELSQAADVPHRLVVEGLIRLMRAGWVEMMQRAEGVTFRITRAGAQAAQADILPSATRRLSRKMNFVIDQVTGSVFRTRELPYLHKHHVTDRAKREPVVWIDPPSVPFAETVRALVDALFFEDEQYVSMDPAGERLAERWALVTVKDGIADGLTTRAPPELKAAIEAAAKKAPKSPTANVQVAAAPQPVIPSAALPQPRRILFSSNDLVLGGSEHREVMTNLIRHARHRVIIHSTFINEARFNEHLPAFRQALAQGARVDVFWGQNEDTATARSTRAVVVRLRERLQAEKLDRLRLHPFSTGSHSKFLIADSGAADRLVAVVGSCNWLYSGFESFEASVRLRDPGLLSDLLEQMAELSRGGNRIWTKTTSELVALAAQQRLRPAGPPGRAEVSLVLAAQHDQIVRAARDGAAVRLFVCSHRWAPAGENLVLAPALAAASQKHVAVSVYFGEASGGLRGEATAEMVRESAKAGVEIRPVRKPRLHAKLLAWDNDAALITSQNLLSADPPDSRPRQEIGVLIRGTGVARTLIDRFEAARME